MNEGDSAGGHRGRNLALPAGVDRRSSITSNTVQLCSGGSVVSTPPMSRLPSDLNLQQMQIVGAKPPQPHSIQQNSANVIISTTTSSISFNNNNSNNDNVIRTQSVVTTSANNSSNLYVSTVASSLASTSTPLSTQDYHSTTVVSPSARKRLKIESGINIGDDISALKKLILEHKHMRLRSIKEKYSEHVAELFFLQTGGNMMEYPVWKKKPHTQPFVNFMRSHKLETLSTSIEESDTTKVTTSNPPPLATSSSLPQGAEIKITGVGVTPVAISTTLPAAVAQLSQQGGTPIVPDPVGIGGNQSSDRKKVSTSLPIQSSNGSTSHNGSGQEQFSVKAKQEVYVMQRISELQREGLWTERRLPKVQEPQRPKAHWDYLLEEMVWLAADFAQERKWKKAAAKKCARMIQKHFQDKAVAAQKAEKAQELQLKRIASFVSKEIKIFWSNVEKLVEFKQQTKLDEKRKKALDQQLSFIVDQTEKYSQQLVEGMNKQTVDKCTSKTNSLNSSRISSPKHKNASDDEFCPENEASDDDEETIAQADAEAAGTNEEVAALQKESEMDLDDFLKHLPKDYLENRDKIVLPEPEHVESEESDCDKDFKAEEHSTDDEDTIMKQEKKEKNEDHKKEIDELNADNEMSIDDLMEKYNKKLVKEEKMEVDSDDDSSSASENEVDIQSESEQESESENEELNSSEDDEKDESKVGLISLLDDEASTKTQSEKDELLNDAAAIAESIQPKGNTLSSTSVVTPIPFLLKHSLREYQHIGLDWLVTMHDRKLNGILADEMGLGKTIQTIALLAHLACIKANWGPHLIIVPSSVMLNWEMEFKKWCPGFKILTYYGSQKERKMKRTGWTKPNAFHVCITSYKLVIQDHQSFRRKKWKYLILDEAQNIKNFKSQRWQLLLNFQTEQRLLLTGTPLQNNLMELWSLMHFLMPHVFQSHREFKEWFSNPMTGMIEGNSEYNESIIKRLHKVLRPFLLRRLKSEVEKQMPKKYEHVIMCRLSKRQRYLYDDFMSRAKTRETLASGNLLSVINVLMQLRKVCNHPNMFEVRPTISPFRMDGINYKTASLVYNMLDYDPFRHVNLSSLNLVLIKLELFLSAYVAHRSQKLITPKKLIEVIDSAPAPPPKCPTGRLKLHVRIRDNRVQENISNYSGVKVGTSPAMKTEGTKFVPLVNSLVDKIPVVEEIFPIQSTTVTLLSTSTTTTTASSKTTNVNLRKRCDINNRIGAGHVAQIVQTSSGRHILLTPTSSSGTTTVVTQSGQRLTVVNKSVNNNIATRGITTNVITKPLVKGPSLVLYPNSENSTPISQTLAASIVQQLKHHSYSTANIHPNLENKKVVHTEFHLASIEDDRKERRGQILGLLAKINQRRCDASPIYGSDLRDSLTRINYEPMHTETLPFISKGFTCCNDSVKNPQWSLSQAIKSIETRTTELQTTFNNFVLFVPAVCAPLPRLHVSHPHPSKLNEEWQQEKIIRTELSPTLRILHPVISAMSTQFPDPRLIQYDCGKLQTLNGLLRRLKTGGHRALIFTQMTRMLDVLEAFLNYHGHIYLRLDGTTKVEQRQLLMERFNGDKRIFVFILSTRSGGVGINLTGADTVIFYDSDWNPTMDAQAQDRCHRIGQTRDVHIYRLVSEKTIEENILKKANQKRMLGDLAIEGGNFTTAFFKSTTIQDLFSVDNVEGSASSRLAEVVERDKERKERLHQSLATSSTSVAPIDDTKTAMNVFESALAAAEDDQDVLAAKSAKAEANADLDEFDENIPIVEENKYREPELSKAEKEVQNIIKQLSPIERYAMRFVEETEGTWTAVQLKAVEDAIEQQKREWEANRLAAQEKEEEAAKLEEAEENEILTFSREDANNQIWISDNTKEKMPMWCPPTPPQDDNDIYVDHSLCFLYETEIIPESQLPAVYVKKDYKRSRSEAGFYADGRRPIKIRKEDTYYPPRSLFDRPTPAIAKLRKDLKLQRFKGIFKSVQIPGLKQPMPMKTLIEPEGMAEWFIYEDMSMLNVIQNLQGLPLNLMLVSPGHTPNWDLVADIVNQASRTYRSPKQCRYRYEAVIIPREEGKLLESPKKQKKNKNPMKTSPMKGVRSMRTSQLFASDANMSFMKLSKIKFDNLKTAFLKKTPQLKQVMLNAPMKNPKHAIVLAKHGITNYDNPPTPVEIAARRFERITKEKQKNAALQGQEQLVQQQQQQQQQVLQQVQHQIQQVQAQNQQQHHQQATNAAPTVATLVQSSSLQGVRQQSVVNICQSPNQQQIVKAIVASPANQNILNQQLVNNQQQQVSVVLTTPVTSLSSNQLSQSQIVSIHQSNNQILQSSASITQATGTLVQTHATQSIPQVVSVAQLQTVMTSANLQPQVATLTTSALRAQRIVAPPGTLQEVVLHQRAGSQSPTVVSVSGLGQGLTQAQLQAAQLRLSMATGQQVTGVVAKGISVGTVTSSGKPINTSQIQFYRQQPIRQQQLKVLHTNQNQTGTVLQTSGGQTTLVSPAGTIIQGGTIIQSGQTMQVQGGQKVSLATVSSSNVTGTVSNVATVATVQMTQGQGRTQLIKQVGGKQTIARPVSESEMQALMVKRQILNQHKQQLIPQTQIFTPANLQVQQAGSSGQQQIATLVKTSSGTIAATGMTLSQVKGGQIKATMANQNQVRQLQLQQQIIAQQRKGGKMTQITQVSKGGIPTQLFVQSPKNMPGTVTVQQIQQVIRHAQPGSLASGGQIVLGKTSVGRVIPVSVSQQNNRGQTIQVVTATSAAQALAAGNIRAHVSGQNVGTLQGSIKVAAGATPAQQQQAILTALQNQQSQRQNASPVRLQTTSGGSLVAVTVQQPQNVAVSSSGNVIEHQQQQQVVTSQQLLQQHHLQAQQQSQQQQQQQQQQVSMIKKKQPPNMNK